MVKLVHRGNFNKTEKFLSSAKKMDYTKILHAYGNQGVSALAAATPADTGLTASSWSYRIGQTRSSFSISFMNSNVVNGVPIAIILQYGHGTRNGGYVQGRDYINPALQPIFDGLAEAAWREITRL